MKSVGQNTRSRKIPYQCFVLITPSFACLSICKASFVTKHDFEKQKHQTFNLADSVLLSFLRATGKPSTFLKSASKALSVGRLS